MSWGTCYSGSNNIHFDYPALMSDGSYTDWNPSCAVNNQYIKQNNIKTNYQYRQFMINNGMNIQKSNTETTYKLCGAQKYEPDLKPKHNGRYLYKSCQDNHRPYGYETSDLKNVYLSRQDLESRMIAPLMSQQGYLGMPNSK
jgi:hypothetical protein